MYNGLAKICQMFLDIAKKKKKTQKFRCKDQIWLEPRTGMDPGPQNPNNKFVESGIIS